MKLKMIEEDIYSNLAVIPITIDSFMTGKILMKIRDELQSAA